MKKAQDYADSLEKNIAEAVYLEIYIYQESYKIYYVNNEETKIVEREYVSVTTDGELLLEELLEQLAHISEKMEYETLLGKEISVEGYTLENGLLTLDFDESYKNLRGTREILVRASIVRTLTQIPGVERMAFTVMGEQLTFFTLVTDNSINTSHKYFQSAGFHSWQYIHPHSFHSVICSVVRSSVTL